MLDKGAGTPPSIIIMGTRKRRGQTARHRQISRARAEEMTNAALFLASDQSAYMTGADLMNDGGVGQV